ncbi:MAG TPA: hypothetical protein VFX60_10480 [Micromonospora sp.]|nr:hypothetical protein [Micromonospora sp.]
MTVLPEPPAATAAGQAANPLTDAVIQAAVDNAIEEARRQGTTPKVVIGNTPPVPQEGRPPMSQKAVDVSTMMLAAGAASVPIGGSVSLVLYTLGHVDPASLAIGAAAPVALVLAVGAMLRRLAGVRTEHHHHYTGPVYQDQRNVHSSTRGLWAKTTNQQ